MSTIKIRRGPEATIPTLNAGELGYTTDTDKVYIGDGATNILLSVAGVAPDSSKLGGSSAALFAKLASPTLTGTPLSPTAALGTNTTQIATTAFINSMLFTESATAGETLVAGNICYLKSDGKYWKTDADAAATSTGRLLMATTSISADASGLFYKFGARWTTTGLTVGVPYFLSLTAGAIVTDTSSFAVGDIIRVVGYAESATVFIFEPSGDWGEVAV